MKTWFILLASFIFTVARSQPATDTVSVDSLKAHLGFLAGDKIGGRGPYSDGLAASAKLIYQCYAKAGLKAFPGYQNYLHPFAVNDLKIPVTDSSGYRLDNTLVNIIGILDGKSKPAEAIIISAHYDHVPSDLSVYNGANDNASGVAALMALVDYYAKAGTNERSIIFCAFSGEEMGLLGSDAFSKLVDEEQVVAMINMDMVGVAEFGKKKFCITGSEYSNLEKIFKKNLQHSPYKIVAEPAGKSLFQRSDNLPFAKLGIPAHTIMTSSDEYRCYHKPCDDVREINFENLAGIVKAVVSGLHTIVSGEEKPSRIKEVLED
jgi:hypothetical protein